MPFKPAGFTVKLTSSLALAFLAVVSLSACGKGGGGSAPVPLKLSTFQAASVVVGQPDFFHGAANQGGSAAADTINDPFGSAGLDSTSGTLFLGDFDNNRVLGFSAIPTANGASANFALGQSSFSGTSNGNNTNQMYGPETSVVFKGKLLVADEANNRVLIWNSVPTSTNTPANVVVGQSGFGSNGSGCTAATLNGPETLTVTSDGKLVVTDSLNNRVLIWNSIPTSNGVSADLVVGQTDFITCVQNNDGSGSSGTPSASNFNYPDGVWSDGKRLVVSDAANNRVLIWNTFPTTGFASADLALGQNSFNCNAPNNLGVSCGSGSPSANNFWSPCMLYSNGTQLFVVDQFNNRVLIWNSFPTSNLQPADVVLGQDKFTCGAINSNGGTCVNGSTNPKGLSNPSGVAAFGKQLVVTDNGNNRYLIFNGH
jgi:NHL repeat